MTQRSAENKLKFAVNVFAIIKLAVAVTRIILFFENRANQLHVETRTISIKNYINVC